MRRLRPPGTCAALAALLALACASSAEAADPLGLSDCGPAEGVHQCHGLVETWDGVPLDTTVTVPSAGAKNLPLVALVHGFGNSKYEYLNPDETAYTGNAFEWAKRGYAVLTYTARGLWGSCGTPDSRAASPGCANGYIHLADTRYEVRDTQELIGRLVDDGIADPDRLGATGDSYGGGQTLALAALRDRVMQPDGSYEPWVSPDGTPLELSAAAPVIPWTDLVHAAAPNGRVSDTKVTSRETATDPVGVEKATVVNAIFAAAQFAIGPGQPVGEPFVPGRPMGYLAPTGTDPESDVTEWVARTSRGEPYDDAQVTGIVERLVRFHSSYYVKPHPDPTPLMLASGFTDDLFPVDHVLRFANRARKRDPRAPLSLLLGDFGHQRASNKQIERERLISAIDAWFARHLLGEKRGRRGGVVAYVGSCPRLAEPLGPLIAPTFGRLSRGRLLFVAAEPGTASSSGGDPEVGLAIDPATGGGDHCAKTEAAEAPGTIRHTLAEPQKRAFTLIGSPKLRAKLAIDGAPPNNTQLAARLWDVDAATGEQVLVTRGVLRPNGGKETWWLNPASWRFEPGHRAELELLGNDAPFQRPSNSSFETEVAELRVNLPTRERRPGG
ncbi:MAG: S15 peptidase family protein [Solirubrobacterales bacterium]